MGSYLLSSDDSAFSSPTLSMSCSKIDEEVSWRQCNIRPHQISVLTHEEINQYAEAKDLLTASTKYRKATVEKNDAWREQHRVCDVDVGTIRDIGGGEGEDMEPKI